MLSRSSVAVPAFISPSPRLARKSWSPRRRAFTESRTRFRRPKICAGRRVGGCGRGAPRCWPRSLSEASGLPGASCTRSGAITAVGIGLTIRHRAVAEQGTKGLSTRLPLASQLVGRREKTSPPRGRRRQIGRLVVARASSRLRGAGRIVLSTTSRHPFVRGRRREHRARPVFRCLGRRKSCLSVGPEPSRSPVRIERCWS